MKKHSMELLAPAGGMDQLKAAVAFGADAVYLAADKFGMRARAANFSMEELPSAIEYAHAADVKVHLTCNVLMMQKDIAELPAFLEAVDACGVDALIIGDAGAFLLAKTYAPHCELHVSTQASVANSEAARLWHSLGASRVVCAREMTLEDIVAMRSEVPKDLEIEAFVHGAQCMAVSGRCLISSYLTGRSGNQGNCTQPCRWSYTLEEEKRPGMHFPVEEDNGTFIMNAKDLDMVAHLALLRDAGVDSIKIEGRNKKAFYVAGVVGAYRRALDALADDRLDDALIEELEEELRSVSHRPFGTGFYFGDPEQATDFDGYEQECIHVADSIACERLGEGRFVTGHEPYRVVFRCRNRFAEGDVLEVLSPDEPTRELTVSDLCWLPDSAEDADFIARDPLNWPEESIDVANRSCNLYTLGSPFPIQPGSFVRSRTYRRSARHENASEKETE